MNLEISEEMRNLFNRNLEPIYFEHEDMNNYEAMRHYLEMNNLDKFVILDDQSVVYLFHWWANRVISLSISGRGDTFNSVIELEEHSISDYEKEVKLWLSENGMEKTYSSFYSGG